MAKNPMQRKAQNSFLLGMLITLLITGIIIAILFMQLYRVNNELKTLTGNRVRVCALNTAVKSGQVITDDLVEVIEVDKSTIPSNAFGSDVSDIYTYSLTDPQGNSVRTNEEGQMYIEYVDETTGQTTNRIIIENGDGFYYQDNNEKVEIISVPMVAKVDMEANTVLTSALVRKNSDLIANDVRKVEYNMIVLPTQLETDSYIDIRLTLPNGKDFIVISHKQVEIPMIDGVESLNTIWLNLDETEILTLSCAIVESYKIPGSKLYIAEYIEPGLQQAATETYIPDDATINLINQDPNCVAEAKQALFERNNDAENKSAVRNPINNSLNENAEDAADNVTDKVEDEIQKTQEERQLYLESLGGNY